jgi:hypothetical protein
MKKYIYIGIGLAILLSIIFVQRHQINVAKKDRDTYRQNTYTLMSDIDRYKVNDSLQAASIGELSLTVGEYEKYRQEDMELIRNLKADKSRLQQVITTQIKTTYKLSGTFRDSIVWRDAFTKEFAGADAAFDSIYKDTLKCVTINDRWFDLTGCIDGNSKFTGRFESRDSLLYVEHVIPKRFLFIKWGVKERRQEIVSRNPHTRIEGAEFVTIRK